MNSKEAFEKMVELCNHYHHTIVKDTDIQTIYGYPIDNIKKDLEVMEILNKHLSIKDYNPSEYPPFIILSGGVIENIEEAKKIKEWLEK